MKKYFTKFSAFNALIWTATLAILLGVAGGLYVVFGPVDVLKNWEMSVGQSQTFIAGEPAYFSSKSEKIISIEGRADRYLVCDATANDIEREIPITSIPLNRPAGVNQERQNAFDVPKASAFNNEKDETTLPRLCKLHIDACYTLWGFRSHCEQAETEKFTVIAKANGDETGEENASGQNNAGSTYQQGTQQNQSQAQQQEQNPTGSTQTTTNNIDNSATTVEGSKPACVVETNLLGLIPIKLGCQ